MFCMDADNLRPYSLRVDYIQKGKAGEVCADYDRLLKVCERAGEHMWGVSCAKYRRYEHIEMDIYVGTDEAFIVRRLEREKDAEPFPKWMRKPTVFGGCAGCL